MQIDRNFRHGDGGNLSPSRLSWFHPINARGHVDGNDDEDDGHDGAYDDAGQGDTDDGDDPATAATGAAGHRAASIESPVIWRSRRSLPYPAWPGASATVADDARGWVR